MEKVPQAEDLDLGFSFASHGVRIKISTPDRVLSDRARKTVDKAFGGTAEIFELPSERTHRTFGIRRRGPEIVLEKDGEELTYGTSERLFFKFLNSVLRIEVGEFAVGKVFLHAGVVGWKGEAIVLPGKSFAGKSTLTAELVRNGAEYYSDEYAVFGPDGYVSPFPRHLTLRYFGATRQKLLSAEDLGGRVGKEKIPVGMILMTNYSRGAEWRPEVLTAGSGVMEMIPNTLTVRNDPAFSLKVLDLVARRAIIMRSPRGDVRKFAKFLLAFFENCSKSARMA